MKKNEKNDNNKLKIHKLKEMKGKKEKCVYFDCSLVATEYNDAIAGQ